MVRVQLVLRSVMLAIATGALTVGCASRSQNVPDNASEVSKASDTVAWSAPSDGKVYLQDDLNKTVVYSGIVRRGQSVKFDPKSDQVLVDGAVAAERIPGGWHEHSLYFQPAENGNAITAGGTGAAPTGAQGTSAGSTNSVLKVPVKVQVDTQPTQNQ